MTRLALYLLLLATLAGCIDQPGHLVVKEDRRRAVTCWQSDSGMACLPNWVLKATEPDECLVVDVSKSKACIELFERHRNKAGAERQLSPHEQESEPTPATALGRWDEERYSL